MNPDIKAINEKIVKESEFIEKIVTEIGKVIVGQNYMIERLLIGLLGNGHILLEGVPGLAKTLTVRTLSGTIKTKFQRIQFTPDLLPADLIGTLIYNQRDGNFTTKKGPIFANLILADEINRSPAKVQSALLEAMSAGVPVVASHIRGFRELVRDGEDGFLVPETNAIALADALERLATDRNLRLRMGEQGRYHAEEFDWERISQRILDFYRELPQYTSLRKISA